METIPLLTGAPPRQEVSYAGVKALIVGRRTGITNIAIVAEGCSVNDQSVTPQVTGARSALGTETDGAVFTVGICDDKLIAGGRFILDCVSLVVFNSLLRC